MTIAGDKASVRGRDGGWRGVLGETREMSSGLQALCFLAVFLRFSARIVFSAVLGMSKRTAVAPGISDYSSFAEIVDILGAFCRVPNWTN